MHSSRLSNEEPLIHPASPTTRVSIPAQVEVGSPVPIKSSRVSPDSIINPAPPVTSVNLQNQARPLTARGRHVIPPIQQPTQRQPQQQSPTQQQPTPTQRPSPTMQQPQQRPPTVQQQVPVQRSQQQPTQQFQQQIPTQRPQQPNPKAPPQLIQEQRPPSQPTPGGIRQPVPVQQLPAGGIRQPTPIQSTPVQTGGVRQPIPVQAPPVQTGGVRQPTPIQTAPVQGEFRQPVPVGGAGGIRQPVPIQTPPIQTGGVRQPVPIGGGVRQPVPVGNVQGGVRQPVPVGSVQGGVRQPVPVGNVQGGMGCVEEANVWDTTPLNDEPGVGVGVGSVPAKITIPTPASLPPANVPDYSSMSEVEQAQHRANFRNRFGILRESWPSYHIPDYGEDVPLEQIHAQYDIYVRHLHISNDVDQYKVYLVIMWLLIELFCIKIGLNIRGYTLAHIGSINK